MISLHTSPYAVLGTGDGGGMNVVVRAQAESLAELGHQVDLYTRRSDPDPPEVEQMGPGIRLHHLTAGPAKPLPKSQIDRWCDDFSHALAERAEPAEVVHSHHWMSGVAALPVARRWGVPHLQSFHSVAAHPGDPLGAGEPPESPHRVPGEVQVARESDLVVAISRAEADTIIDRCGADPDRVVVLPPGVDTELFRPLAPEERPWTCCDMGRPYVFFAARLQPLKGPDLALETLARIDPEHRPHLVMAGDVSADFADYHGQVERLAHRLGIANDVVYSGARPRAEFAAMMRGAQLVLMPSHSETFGLVALESAASGVPIIASAAGGLIEAVDDGRSGILMQSRDPDLWAKEVQRLLLDDAGRLTMAAAAREWSLRFDWAGVARRLAGIYQDALRS
ncbi:glycosyltransferase [Naumannella sp. ID2617S]|nr:glycosyltransferase [Naumannella sp. ID2617S]